MDRLFLYLTNLSSNSAYFIVFAILVACGVGFPLPEDIPLIAAGYLCWDGTLEIFPSIGITFLGVLAGDTILFFLGKNLGIRILEKERIQTLFRPAIIRRTRAYFRKYGDKIVFFARFVAGFRAAAFFMAGALKMKFRRFLWLDAAAALVSVPIWIALGYLFGYFIGDEISQILKSIRHLKTILSLIGFSVVAVLVGRAIWNYRFTKLAGMKKKSRR